MGYLSQQNSIAPVSKEVWKAPAGNEVSVKNSESCSFLCGDSALQWGSLQGI